LQANDPKAAQSCLGIFIVGYSCNGGNERSLSMASLNSLCNWKTCFVFALVLVMGLFAWIINQGNSPSSSLQSESASNTSSNAGLDHPKIVEPDEISVMSQPPLDDSKPTVLASTAPEVWRIGGATDASPSISLPARATEYEPVRVDMEHPSYPGPGTKVIVAVPGNESFQVNVEQSAINPNGDYTWRGHVEGYGDDYPVIMTYGHNSVFATITTPKGSYTLETLNGSGWVYKNPSEFELSEHGKNDYLEPPKK
jgi:hypothetical protein